MAFTIKKKVFKHGAASCIGLPQSWLRYYGSRAEQITLTGSSILLIVPAGLEPQAEVLVKQMEDMPWLLPVANEVSDIKPAEEIIRT